MPNLQSIRRAMLATASVFALLAAAPSAFGAVITATWDGGAGGWATTALAWTPDIIPNNTATNQFNVKIDGGKVGASAVTLNTTVTIDSLTVDLGDSLTFSSNRAMTIVKAAGRAQSGKIENNGAITLNSTAAASAQTSLLISGGDVNLTGSGKIVLNTTGATLIDPTLAARLLGGAGAGRLTQAATHTIEGAGQLGGNTMAFTNNGVVDANRAGRNLIVNPNATGAVNAGAMRATSGGILTLSDGTFANAGGTIEAQDTSLVDLQGAAITGGTLSTAGSGVIRNTSTATLDGVTNAGAVEGTNGSATTLKNTVTNNASIALKGSATAADLVVQGAVTLGGFGSVVLADIGTSNRVLGSGGADSLLNGSEHTIRGAGVLGGGGLGLTNLGLIDADQANALSIDVAGAAFTNDGTLRASGAGGIAALDATVTNTSVVNVQGGSQFVMAAPGATYNQSGGNTLIAGAMTVATYNQNTGVTAVDGTLNADVTVNGGILKGGGKVAGVVTNLAGTVAPGNSPGVLNVDGLSLGSGGALEIEIEGLIAGLEYDVLEVGVLGAVLDGTVNVLVGAGFAGLLTDGALFKIINVTGGPVAGTFDAIIDNLADFHFVPIYGTESVTLRAVSDRDGGGGGRVPEPAAFGLLGFGYLAALVAVRSRRARRR